MEALKAYLGHAQQFGSQNPTLIWGLVLASIGLALAARMMTALARGFKTCPNCQKVVPVRDESCRYCRVAFGG
jgi:hypothetical protein